MPKANDPVTYSELRPIVGTPWETDWQGYPSECSHCLKPATHVVRATVASRYSSERNRTRTYRLCAEHVAKYLET